jgi:hypothetical protein
MSGKQRDEGRIRGTTMSRGNQIAAVLYLVCAVSVGCSRQAGSANSGSAEDTVKELTALETRLWDAWRTRNRQTLDELFAADYYYVGDDGLEDRQAVFKEFDAGVALTGYEMGPVTARQLTPDSWMLAYRATMRGVIASGPVEREEMEASVWARRNGRWQEVFLHEVEPKK